MPKTRLAKHFRDISQPYGAVPRTQRATLQYEASFAQQLTKHGLTVPDMDLFPSSGFVKIRDNEYQTCAYHRDDKHPDGYVVGGTRIDARDFISNDNNDIKLDNPTLWASRAFIALHETMHHVVRELRLTEKLGERESSRIVAVYDGLVMTPAKHATHVGEKVADCGAVLYMLSNYSQGVDPFVSHLKKTREGADFIHDTISIIDPVMAHYQKSPHRGRDLYECAQQAADIADDVARQMRSRIIVPRAQDARLLIGRYPY